MDDELLYALILFLRRYLGNEPVDLKYEEFQARELLEKLEEIAETT